MLNLFLNWCMAKLTLWKETFRGFALGGAFSLKQKLNQSLVLKTGSLYDDENLSRNKDKHLFDRLGALHSIEETFWLPIQQPRV